MHPLFALHRSVAGIANIMAGSFLWVMVFVLEVSRGFPEATALSLVAGLFTISSVTTLLLLPFCARLLEVGIYRSIILACTAAAAAYIPLSQADPQFLSYAALSLFAIAVGFYNACYWTPYGVAEGKGGAAELLAFALAALIPIVLGSLVLTETGGIQTVFALIGCVYILSTLPLLYIRERYEGFSWDTHEVIARLFSIAHRRLVFVSMCAGIERTALVLALPLFLFLQFDHSFPILGLLMSVSILLSLLVAYLLKIEPLDRTIRKSAAIEAAVRSGMWLLRVVVSSPFSFAIVQSVAAPFEKNHTGSFTFVDEYTVLSSAASALGSILAATLLGCLFVNMPVPAAFLFVFLLAAVAATFHSFARK